MKKGIPIGEYDFSELRKRNCYYVDKTQVIEELLKNGSKVFLFPRPRRFGKSLFLSMLSNFFNIEKKDINFDLFDGLYISNASCFKELSKYPVIYLDLKDVKTSTYTSTFALFKSRISSLYTDKKYIREILDEDEKKKFDLIKSENASEDLYKDSLKLLSEWLERYYNEKVIILIDEYDAPINEGYISNYYEKIMELMKPLLSNALKGNDSLKMGILTGVLRVGGESLFSSFNNIKIYDIMSEHYNEYFGFTEKETRELLEYYDLELTDEVKSYYDGYNFGGISIYNPWSILNYASDKKLLPFWMNTGSNKLVKDLLSKVKEKEIIEKLIQGESISFQYNMSISYESFTNPKDLNNILNLLLVCGYLTYEKSRKGVFGRIEYFKIPNKEVRNDFVNIVESVTYSSRLITNYKYEEFLLSLLNDNKEFIEKFINNVLPSISYYDFYENFYHGYVLGLFGILLNNDDFIVKSNRETGEGRCDILIEKIDRSIGIIIEFKIVEDENDMESMAIVGKEQMREKEYYKELVLDKVSAIHEYVIVFSRKSCIVR